MGKASRLKQLRKVAEVLPVVMRNTHEIHYVKGQELLDQGHFEVAGKEINPEATYIVPMPVMIAINHKRNMKKLYRKYGEAGINTYANHIIKNHAS